MALHVMDEANRCLQCKNPQCVKGCPISTPIPTVIRLLKENKMDEAGRMLFENKSEIGGVLRYGIIDFRLSPFWMIFSTVISNEKSHRYPPKGLQQ